MELTKFLKRVEVELKPDPDCSICKGSGEEEYESPHDGDYETCRCGCFNSGPLYKIYTKYDILREIQSLITSYKCEDFIIKVDVYEKSA